MNISKSILSLTIAGALSLAAIPASAATWLASSRVLEVTVTENTSHTGPSANAEQLEIKLETPGSHCGSTQSMIVVRRNESPTLFDNWVKTAQAALLSGKQLRIGSSNNTGTCYTWYLTLVG